MDMHHAFQAAIKPLNLHQVLPNLLHMDMGDGYDITGPVAMIASADPEAEGPDAVELTLYIDMRDSKSRLFYSIALEFLQDDVGVTEKQVVYEHGYTEEKAVALFIEHCKLWEAPDAKAFAAIPLLKEMINVAVRLEQINATL
jgi:hypothetical protein